METQTAECLVVAEITCDKMILVLNKIDLLDSKNRDLLITKMTKKLKITLDKTKFRNSPIISVSASPSNSSPFGKFCLEKYILRLCWVLPLLPKLAVSQYIY